MNWFARTFNYSIGRKIIMALTGLFLVFFLIEHVFGNLLLFANDGGAAFNEYSHDMSHNTIIRIVEYLLFAGIIFHFVDGFILWSKNRSARPIRYQMSKPHEKTKWTSRNMIWSGSVILIFLVIHLKSFFVPYRITDGMDGKTLFEITRDAFANPYYSAFYVFAMILLGLHLNHGFSSAFQTLGLRHPNFYSGIKILGVILSLVISLGFASMPIYFYLQTIMN
jgi:succinate dehydrogenase / fumarate reductase cytochrome b subunit